MTLEIETEAFDDGMRTLDKEVVRYTEQRKENHHDDFVATLTAAAAAAYEADTKENEIMKVTKEQDVK